MSKIIFCLPLSIGLSSMMFLANPQLAQAEILTLKQIPSLESLSHPNPLNYSDRVNDTLGFKSYQFKNRRFAAYQFQGKKGQLIRISILGGLASERDPNKMIIGSPLVNPVLILLDPAGNILAQKPDATDTAGGVIRLVLPLGGRYVILVTSGDYNTGGRYSLNLEQLKQDTLNPMLIR